MSKYTALGFFKAIENVTPRDKYIGKDKEIFKNRMKIKNQTARERDNINKSSP